MFQERHRRTGNFLPGGPGGGVNYLPKKGSQVTPIFTKQSKRNEGYTRQQHRPTYEVKVFLHMNLSYELIKQVKEIAVSAILTAEDINDTIRSFSVNKCDVTDTLLLMVLWKYVFRICTTH